ncbi:hypothetical protein HK096_006381 [Nowakowskiella sp. JEL0078]|nr:hypothetical protein HK096_006381 [Nowakowskiella sp. JEL0078]
MIYPTSWIGIVHRGKLQKGEICLIHAASSGVGLAALQIAKSIGATVIATAGSDQKLRVCKDHGADYVIDYRKDLKWWETVNQIVQGLKPGNKGVDVVYKTVVFVSIKKKWLGV